MGLVPAKASDPMANTPEEEDILWMQQARAGDMEAFARLLARHRRRVQNFLYRLFWDREKAEDGTQEVFVRLWMARTRYQERARFTTFLYQIAHNYWIDERRKAGARPQEVELPSGADEGLSNPALLAPATTEPQQCLFQRYRQRRIREAIAGLPDRYRAVFVLGHLEERRTAEIAAILGIPQGTVKSRMYAAVRMLRARLIADEEDER